jgi:TolB-like protein/Flp pilus assembly protein TadD
MALAPGTRLGPYEIESLIGSGGMGEVYRARDTRLHRQVAIKILPGSVPDRQFRERFDREARAVAALSHPNIVAIYDVGTHDDTPYAATELLEGETLRSRIGASALPVRTAVDYAVQIARGLAAAHGRGIVHRDLKPDNVFVTPDNQIKILDFGLATQAAPGTSDESTRLGQTESGMVVGTVGYMSPEQARGTRADERSDIFSFGCVLYEMVSARRAFSGNSRIETLHAILKDNPPDLATTGRDIPSALERVIMHCLEKAPEGRFQSARDLVFALENLTDAAAGPTDGRPSPLRRARRGPVAAGIAALVIAAGGALWWTTGRDEPSVEPKPPTTAAADPRWLLAVLPFENVTRDGGAGYFAAGMTDEVTSQLSKLSTLRIVGRPAVAAFKSGRSDLPGMVKELGIGSLVTGTVREDGSRVRVNVELMDARSGQVLWSEQYDREGVDVFSAQSDIALRIAEALQATVTLEEQSRVGKRPTASVAAYQLFIRERGMRGGTRATLLERIDLLNQAIALDPRFALAYARIAEHYQFLASFGDTSAPAKSIDAAHKALAIDPQLAQAHHALGLGTFQAGQLRESLAAMQKSTELDPSFISGLVDFGQALNTAGRFDEALHSAKRALPLMPNQATVYYHVGMHLVYLDADSRAERFLAPAAVRFPAATRLQILLSYLDLRRGRPDAALDRIRRTVDNAPTNVEALLTRLEVAALMGSADAGRYAEPLMAESADAPTQLIWHSVKLLYAYQLHKEGQNARASELMDQVLAFSEEAIKGGADWMFPRMQIATVHAIRGDVPAALDWLERAYQAGWRDPRIARMVPMWVPLRGTPRFEQLVARMEADLAAMRARADYSGLP